jgi:multidrug resistance efflux pump
MNDKRRSFRLFWILGLLLLVGSVAGARMVLNNGQGNKDAENPNPSGNAPGDRICLGYVDSEHGIAALYPAQTGRVTWVVSENKKVRKGDVLLRLDDRQARLHFKQAETALAEAQEQLKLAEQLAGQHPEKLVQQGKAIAAARSNRESVEFKIAQLRKMVKANQVPENELKSLEKQAEQLDDLIDVEKSKERELKLLNPELAVTRAKLNIKAKEEKVQEAQLGVEECEVKAPTDGTILRVLVHLGEVLNSQPKLPAIQFCPKGPRLIRAEVLQEFAGGVEVGQLATIEDDTRNGPRWTGKVISVSDWFTQRRSIVMEPFQYNDVRTLECLVSIDPSGPPLRIWQRVRVKIKQTGP